MAEEESDESEEEEEQAPTKGKGARIPSARGEDVSDEEKKAGEEEGDEGWWGSSRKEYYDADNIETEADALVGSLYVSGCHSWR